MRSIELTYTKPQLDIFFPSEPCKHTVIPKGRRFGATRGAAHACIEWMHEGKQILWGDTIHSNITRYVERYFIPAMKQNDVEFNWRAQEKLLRVGDGYIDFRSADNPANWEGFGYDKIILNEAGIILKDPYLYTNAVRPMMIDPGTNAELFALGVPKGKVLKDGTEHPFFTLWKGIGKNGYRGQTYTSYDNPLLSKEDIEALESDITAMDEKQVRQEIYGEFIDRVAGIPFAHAFDPAKNVRAITYDPTRPLYISLDFNLDPFAFIYANVHGKKVHIFGEETIPSGTLDEACDRILSRFGRQGLALATVTGDYNGTARQMLDPAKASLYRNLQKKLGLSDTQLDLKPNPRHVNSRHDVNWCLRNIDFIIDPSCVNTLRDFRTVEVDADGSIIKADRKQAAQRADHLDAVRYLVNSKAVRSLISL